MTDTIKIYNDNQIWYVDDELGTWVVRVIVDGPGWIVNALGLDDMSLTIAIGDFRYSIKIYEYHDSICKYNTGFDGEYVNTLEIPLDHPAIGFFKKYGHIGDGPVQIIPVTESFKTEVDQ